MLLPLSLELGRPRQKDDLDENPQAKEASSAYSKGETVVHNHHQYQSLNILVCSLLNKTNWSRKLNIVRPMDLVHLAVQSIDFFLWGSHYFGMLNAVKSIILNYTVKPFKTHWFL
jgi:hypothetical protein